MLTSFVLFLNWIHEIRVQHKREATVISSCTRFKQEYIKQEKRNRVIRNDLESHIRFNGSVVVTNRAAATIVYPQSGRRRCGRFPRS